MSVGTYKKINTSSTPSLYERCWGTNSKVTPPVIAFFVIGCGAIIFFFTIVSWIESNEKQNHNYIIPNNAFSFDDIFDLAAKSPDCKWSQTGEEECFIVKSEGNEMILSVVNPKTLTTKILLTTSIIKNLMPSAINLNPRLYSDGVSPDSHFILFSVDTIPIFRSSTTSIFYIYNTQTDTVQDLSNTYPNRRIHYAKWAPNMNSYWLALVTDDSVIVLNAKTGEETLIAKSNDRFITYGYADWMHEEEILDSFQTLYWNINGTSLVFAIFDSTDVPFFRLDRYSTDNPHNDFLSFPYPYPGDTIASISLMVVNFLDFLDIDVHTEQTFNFDRNYLSDLIWIDEIRFVFRIIPRVQVTADYYIYTLEKNGADFNVDQKRFAQLSLDDTSWVANYHSLTYLKGKNAVVTLWDDTSRGFVNIAYLSLDSETTITSPTFLLDMLSVDVTSIYGYDSQREILYFEMPFPTSLERHIFTTSLSDIENQYPLYNAITIRTGVHHAVFSPSASYYVHTYSNNTHPVRISIMDSSSNVLEQEIMLIEDNSFLLEKLKKKSLPTKELMLFNNPQHENGLYLSILYPPNFNHKRKYPVYLTYYCGPDSSQVFHGLELEYNAYLASTLGIVVITLDPRGTCCRGIHFRTQVKGQLGLLESEDLIMFVKTFLLSRKWVDPQRIACAGWSYGGFMTLMLLSHENADIFRTGIATAPVTSWHFYDAAYTERFMYDPDHNTEGYNITAITNPERISNLINYSSLDREFLLCFGTRDDNVHPSNSLNIINHLETSGVHFVSQLYTNDDHSIDTNNHRKHLYSLWTSHLHSHLIEIDIIYQP